jgi:hypothetical protein
MAKQRLVKKGSQYGILDEASNTVLPISDNMKLVQKQGQYGVLDGDSVIPIDNFSETITDSDLDILKKKNTTASVGQPAPKPGSSASPKIQGSGIVASPAKQGKVPVVAKPVPSKEDKEEIGILDDLWNTVKGAGANTLAILSAIPQYAQTTALDVFMSATGMKSDFSKLPSSDKKQIRDALNAISTASARASGTATQAIPVGANLSQKSYDFLNKKSEDIYKKTRQEQVDVVDELDKFRKNPNAESIEKILYQGLKTTVQSAPYMVVGAVSLPLLGVASAAGKRQEDLAETGGDLGLGYALNAGITGTAEAIFEGTTQKILGKAIKAAAGNAVAAKAVAEGFIKSILKDFGLEGISEGLTTLVQEISDKITKGEEIKFFPLAKKVANSTILGGIGGAGISTTGASIGATRRYIAGRVMPKKQIEKIDNNIKTIQSLNLEQGDDVDPRVNKIVNKKINDLIAENEAIVAENEAIAANLSGDQIKQVFDIDDKLEENFNSAKSIIDDAAMDESAKKLLLQDLLDQQNNLKQEKDAIQEQATSQIPVQPEAGGSLQMAEGEPQAEPQVPAKESKKIDEQSINKVFEANPELKNIGSSQQYSDYLDTIFPDTKVKDIVFHGSKTKKPTEGFLETAIGGNNKVLGAGKGFYFTKDIDYSKNYGDTTFSILDVKSPIDFNSSQYDSAEELEKAAKELPNKGDAVIDLRENKYYPQGEEKLKTSASPDYVVFKPEQIYTLGSDKDIEGFKNFVSSIGKVEETVVPEQQETEQKTAVKKGVDAVNKAVGRGRPLKKAVEGGIAFMQKTIAYEQADDVTREQMLRDINKEFGVKEKKAPSVKKVMGEAAQKKVTVNEMTALKDQIKLESKAAKGAEKATDQIRKDVAEKVKSFITRGGLSKAQQKSLLNSLAKTNILNPVMRERLFERMQKMFKRADYQDRIKEASAFRNRIKKLAKSDTLQASVAKMAKDFAKVIPEFTDVDVYLENAREVYNAIKKPVRNAASIDAISAFTTNELAKQEEKVKNTLLDQYDYLAEAGLIDESMSLAEIQKYILDVESGTKPDAKVNEEQIRANIFELFDSMAETVNAIAEDGYNPLINEEVELDAYTKKLLKNFTSMDLSRLSVADAYRATEALDNYLTNDIVDNMEAIYKVYEGGVEAKSIEDQNIVAQDFRRLFGGKAMNFLSRAWTAAFSPVKSTLDLVHRSRTVGSKVFDAMGLRTLSNEASRAKTEANSIDKAYVEKFDRKKPNGKDFRDVENVFERGIYAHLKRTINGTADQVAAEFTRRKDQVILTIDALIKSEDEKLVKRGKVLESIFSRMQDATNISEVEAVIDPINKDAVNWWTTVYDKYYPEVKKIASSVYNTVLEDDVNYTPDNYEKIVESEETDVDKVKTFKMAFDFLNQQKSGTLMENKYIEGIPANRVISFDFDYNNSSAFGKMLTDIRTAPSMLQYKGFVQSPSFKKIYPNAQDRQVIQDKLTYYVNEVRSKNVATGSVDAKKFAKVIQAVSRYGTSRALGSFTAGVKQAGTALMNTSIALANDPKSVTKGISLLFNKDAQKFLENSGYGIANRGLESQTAIESANRVIEQTDVNSANKVADAIAKAGKIYLEYSLKNGDVLAARASWYAYYLHDLKKQGIDTTNIDWKNHELNKKAANYAEDQINLQQNVSDASMMGKFLTSKNPYVTITRSMVLPFSSFIFNAKDKITTDVTILTSKNSNNLDKIDAAKSLAATGAEMIMFEALAATISSAIVIGANSILGIEEDEEDREKRRDQYFKSAVTRFATDVLSPIPNLGDKAIVSLINKLLDLAQSDLDEEDKFKLFEYKPQSEIDAMLNIVGGIPEVAAKPLIDMGDTIYKITSDTYIDRFGNEIELSYEDKSKLMYVLAVELIAATNILPAEIVRLNEKVKQQIEKEAR